MAPTDDARAEHAFDHRHNTFPRVPFKGRLERMFPGHVDRDTLTMDTQSMDRPTMDTQTMDTQSDLPALQKTSTDLVRPEPSLLMVDFTSPWAYLAHLRLDSRRDNSPEGFDDLAEGGSDDEAVRPPTWAAIQVATDRPLVGVSRPGPERDRMREELEAVRALARSDEELPENVPAMLPHPRPVAAAYAEAVDLGRGPQARALLLHAYWIEGQDIGNPEILRRLMPKVLVDADYPCTGDPRREFGYVVSPIREPLTNAAYHLLETWQHRWEDLGRPGPLALVGPDSTRTGAAALPAGQPALAL